MRLLASAARAAGLSLAVCVVACHRGNPDARIQRAAAALQAATVPPNGRIVATSPVSRDVTSAAISWDIETPWTWDEYRRRVESRLAGFKTVRVGATDMELAKSISSDDYTLHVEWSSGRVRVTFRAFAD